MNRSPLSPETFRWILTVLILAGALWALFDVVKLARTRGKDASDPLVRDERFGYAIGIVIGLFAISGVLRYHNVL
jgi:uncharacterized membrane protein YfcA